MSEASPRKGWTHVAFGDVVRLNRERSSDPEADGLDRYVGLEHIEPNDLKIRHWGHVADGTTFNNVFRPGQVLFGKRRAYQRKVAVPDFGGVCSGDIYVLESKDSTLLPELLPFVCQTNGFFEYVIGTSAGSLSPRTNWASLAKYEFALPPLEEQRRIVQTLTATDATTNALVNARAAANRVRMSALNRIFEPLAGDVHSVSLGQLLEDGSLWFQTGPFGTVLSAGEYRRLGWPIVNPTHIKNGQISHGVGPYVDDATAVRLGRYRMKTGDVLLARKGEIDKACIVPSNCDGWIVGSDCILLRSDPQVLIGQYLLLFLQAPSTSRTLRSLAHGTVMPGLNEKMLALLLIPLPRPNKQAANAAVVQELDAVETGLAARAKASIQVRIALLAKAFTG